MPEGIEWPLWVIALAGIGIVSTAMLALTALLVKTGRGVGVVGHFLWGRAAAQIVSDVEARLAPQLAELVHNGGATVKDKVDLASANIEAMRSEVSALSVLMIEHIRHSDLDRGDIRRWLEHIDPGRMTDPRLPGEPPPDDPEQGD